MLQIDTRHFASDALEDAMRLAQTKALNSYTFSDCINFLNYAWSDIYSRMAMIDDGYYGTNVRITKRLTKLPPFVKNTVQVYSAQSPVGYDRVIFRSSGTSDMTSAGTYRISGTDLFCPDAERRTVWLYYVPQCPQLFFTHHNRDPIIHENDTETTRSNKYNLFFLYGYTSDGTQVNIQTATRNELTSVTKWTMQHRGGANEEDITEQITAAPLSDDEDGSWQVVYISCDYPYIFVTYQHTITKEHISGFFDKGMQFNIYNPFEFTGRNCDVEYLQCKWNDKTGMGVILLDYNDMYTENGTDVPRVKELGWTPDTRLNYPIPEMYRYLVARLADKFAALNESDVMGVQKELVEAHYAFEAYLDRDKSSFKRIENVNPATIGDWL